jgi:hypothetical protein
MFEIKNSKKDIKNSNCVYFIETKKDISVLDYLKLDKKIITKIEEKLKENTSELLSFFL